MCPQSTNLDRNLAMELVRVTEAASLAVFRHVGRGDPEAADRAAAEAMWQSLNGLTIDGEVIIGEGEVGGSPWLYAGQKVGNGKLKVDLALDPIEGITACAKGEVNVVSVVAATQAGGFLKVPDIYMNKIAVGPLVPPAAIDLDATPEENLQNVAEALNVDVGDLLVCIMDRPRHEELIAKVRKSGARIKLINDGDVSGILTTAMAKTGVDVFMGIGGAPEGVLAAAAMRCIGGHMQARLEIKNPDDASLARNYGIKDPEAKFTEEDMARGDVMLAATGVTNGPALSGVRRTKSGVVTHSLAMRAKSGTVRMMKSYHDFSRQTDKRMAGL